jgi:predicted alpha/beta hydrolase family esterase
MQARRGIALLLSCVLGLLLMAPAHAAAQPKHVIRGTALVAPAGVETPHPWRSAPDDALAAEAHHLVAPAVRSVAVALVRHLPAHDNRTPHVRGPPGSALA